MSVFQRGKVWQYDFWVKKKRYQGSIPEAQNKTQARLVETRVRADVFEAAYCLPDKQLPHELAPKKLTLVAPGKTNAETRANIVTFRAHKSDGSPNKLESVVFSDAYGPVLFLQDEETGNAVIFDWQVVADLIINLLATGESYLRGEVAPMTLTDAPPALAPGSETIQ